MKLKRCPSCGSTYFLSSRSAGRIVFQVDTTATCIAIKHQGISDDHPITAGLLCCGACSWDGELGDLLIPQD